MSAAAFEQALSAHRPYLLRFARRRLADAALVEDVVQETLLAALQGAARFEHRASLRTWLTGILLNRIADHLRHAMPRAELPADAPPGDPDGAPRTRNEPVDWHDPARTLEGREELAAVGACLDALPIAARRALTLREIEGWSHDRIARELGITPAYCAVLLHRARARLRDCVGFN